MNAIALVVDKIFACPTFLVKGFSFPFPSSSRKRNLVFILEFDCEWNAHAFKDKVSNVL